MRKALVFVAAFALVLVAGAAVAFMSAPGDDVASDTPQALEKPTTTSTFHEKEAPPTTDKVQDEEHKEDPPKEEDKADEPEEVEETKDTDPPDLVILHPENGQHFDEARIAFEGKTEPGARVFAGKYEAEVDTEGNWRIILILQKGGNLASFAATDEAGNESHAQVKAYYDAPKEEPKDEEPKEYDFSANQKYGSCSENPAYDKFYGKGTPGTKIWIESKYGSGTTTIGDHGEWSLKVTFPEAPCGKTFDIVLETDDGDRKVFSFTRICEDEGGDEGGDDK